MLLYLLAILNVKIRYVRANLHSEDLISYMDFNYTFLPEKKEYIV